MFINRKHTKATKEKMRKARLGIVHSEETKKKISQNHARAWLGRKHKKISKNKIGLIHRNKKVSVETRKKLHDVAIALGYMKKENNPNWKGGITPLNFMIRTSREYKLWREAVFKRDEFTCQDCGDNKGGNLEAHHIKPFSAFPELRLAIDNGVTLCKKCHKKTETYGAKLLVMKYN